MTQMRMAEKKRSRALFPVMGLLLGVAVGLISWFSAPEILKLLPTNLRTLFQRLPGNQEQIWFAVFMFVVLMAIFSILIAIASPKKKVNVKDSDIMKERRAMLNEKANRQYQARKIAQENRKSVLEEDSERRRRER